MNITKIEFKEMITSKPSLMLGIFKEIPKLNSIQVFNKDGFRTAKERGKYIEFSNGSLLDINTDKYNKRSCQKVVYDKYTVLILNNSWYDDFDEKWYDKYMLYYVEN